MLNTLTENGVVTLKTVTKTDPLLVGNSVAGVSFIDGTRLEDVLLNNTNTNQTITYEFEARANGCISPSTFSTDVTVIPLPEMVLTNNAPILCSDELTDIEFSSPTVGAVIELIGTNTTPNAVGVTGITAVNTTWNVFPATIGDNLINNTNATQVVEYIFEVSAGGFTNPTTESVFIEVRPRPDIAASIAGICSEGCY